ncbi:Hypothetical predicted protein [Olea europaea subsp. europaea]|uniref:Zinc finger PMZ-type domain-containing protein n=1 Tax=Olea europaea subsp. europaea TaxID=158383 RepID=A0A8S0UKT5_OLEEU|nr:Hypothetical predicted protein [Olea europaea subsp. europaea]
MGEMEKESSAAHNWLKKRHPSKWSRAYFQKKVKSDILFNNLCEVFNNVVLEEREKSILTMLIDLHISFMKRIQARRDKMRRVAGPLCPKVQKKLMSIFEIVELYEVDWFRGAQSYVKCSSGEYVVDLMNKTWAYRKWDLTRVPCAHAVAAIIDGRDEPWKYVHESYRVSTYMSCYENIINPINGIKLWPQVDAPPIKPLEWFVPKRGRKQKKRRRQVKEDVITRSGSEVKLNKKGIMVITCSLCGGTGHNKSYYQKANAPHEDLSYGVVDHTYEGSLRDVGSERLRVKLVPRRQSGMPPSEMQPPEQSSNFLFMPTPGIGLYSAAQFTNYGLPLNEPASSTMEKSPLKAMVEDLQKIENQEKQRKRTVIVKNTRIVRGSVPYAPPRKKFNNSIVFYFCLMDVIFVRKTRNNDLV